MKDVIIVHYSEIGLKGKNKKFFVNKLKQNIINILHGLKCEVEIIEGRFLIYFEKDKTEFKKRLLKVFGIYSFCFAKEVPAEIGQIKHSCAKLLSSADFETFRITTKRSQKDFNYTSMQVSQKVGEHVLEKLNKKVKLKKPDLECFIEIVQDNAFIYFEKIKALGGMPAGTAGKVICLLSSGFDSPIASYKIMKRGAKVIFVHFHNYPYTQKESINNVKKLIDILKVYQNNLAKYYLIEFTECQKQIVAKTESKYRVILYRRLMIKIAQQIAKQEKALALVTGDSLGQVASQTLENIFVINDASEIPVFRPLIGDDKQEIMDLAKTIGTYDTCCQPYQDCCSMFTPKNPETKAKLEDILAQEKKLDYEKLIKLAKIEKLD